MLGMAFFKSLVKQHGVQFFEPVGKALAAAGIKKLSPMNPAHMWALRRELPPYAAWLLSKKLSFAGSPKLPPMPTSLRQHAEYACRMLPKMSLEIDGAMRKHQLKLADRQLRMSELSSRVQKLVTMLCASLYAAQQNDEVVHASADILCHDLTRLMAGGRATAIRAATLGEDRRGRLLPSRGFRQKSDAV
jgi:hypothetical protein